MRNTAEPFTPFDLDNDADYMVWREQKLHDYPTGIEQLMVEVQDPRRLTQAEVEAIRACCRKTNMAIYAGLTGNDPDKGIPTLLGEQFGLTELDRNMGADDDGVTALKVAQDEWREGYIPYTNRPIHWHSDGYYNGAAQQIRALILHCLSPAARGGENALLDHEVAYIHLRDTNPDYIRALMKANAMTIPANIRDGKEIRPARSGPVFSIFGDGSLHMRYTARTRSIEWSQEPLTLAAVKTLEAFLDSSSAYIYRATLQPGQGLICNNVLHDRSGFDDDGEYTRQLYRLRYYQRMTDT
jgi:alpha-ketoglutarate-dependent taurine dioxygenase